MPAASGIGARAVSFPRCPCWRLGLRVARPRRDSYLSVVPKVFGGETQKGVVGSTVFHSAGFQCGLRFEGRASEIEHGTGEASRLAAAFIVTSRPVLCRKPIRGERRPVAATASSEWGPNYGAAKENSRQLWRITQVGDLKYARVFTAETSSSIADPWRPQGRRQTRFRPRRRLRLQKAPGRWRNFCTDVVLDPTKALESFKFRSVTTESLLGILGATMLEAN